MLKIILPLYSYRYLYAMRYLQSESEKVDDSWSFKELDRLETSYLTHSYHTYPTKFNLFIINECYQAMEHYDKALQIDPKFAEVLHNKGLAQ
jgi:hypothetical protein